MDFEDNITIGFGLFVLVVGLLAIGGWVANIIKVFGLWAAPVTAEIIVRLIGVVFPPLGAIAGYF